MKNKRLHSYIWMILCIGSLLMVSPVIGTVEAQEAGGYWELISVDIEQRPPLSPTYTNIISRGSGVFRAENNGEIFQATMTWTEPGQRYAGGQSIDLTLSANIDEYLWDDDEPGYLNQGLNYMGADVNARIDEPDVGYGGTTRGAISFTDSDGNYRAHVDTDYGKIVIGSQTLQVSAELPSGGSDGDKISIYVTCSVGMNRYNYQWVGNDSEGLITIPENLEPELEPEWEPLTPTTSPASGGALSRIIVVVGIAIAGTMSAIAGELANKAAQAAASGKDEQPTEEIVYVLNPSHKRFNLEVNQPVTLTVNGYRVTHGGYQIEPDAHISISLPPDMAEYFNLQTTGSTGQVSCIITLLKIPSASTATLEVNGVFPKGKANTQVQLAFKTKFAISPVNSPNITYYEKDKQWRAPELVACFRDAVQNTPIKVGFYYGFTDPPLTFEPDILEVKEGYSSDDGLTYNFKLNVKEGIDLETYFGEDLTDDNGRVTVKVVVKDEQGKEYAAKTELQIYPQLKMISYAYDPEKGKGKNNRPKTPYPGLELEDLQFIADGIDILPILFFFVRTDKELVEGEEYLSALDLVDVLSVKFTAGKFPDPEVSEADSGDGLFAYKVRSSDFIPYTKEEERKYALEVEPVMRTGAPKNIGMAGMNHLILVSPQFMKFHFWVVPGEFQGTSEAFAYVQLHPSKTGVPNMPLTLEIENPPDRDRGFLELINGDQEQNTRDPKPGELTYRSNEYIPLPKGSACWGLRYSGIRWDNLNPSVFGASSPSEFRVICTGPESDTGPIWQTSQTINVGQNINTLLSDLLSSADSLQLNCPYWKDSVFPYFIRGALTNMLSWIVPEYETYVCKEMRSRIIEWLKSRSIYEVEKGDDPKKIQLMLKMNGIEYEFYEIYGWHVWAGIFLSGSTEKYAKALDPWWEQRWDDPSLKNHENLITVYTEYTNLKLSERGLSVRAISTIIAAVLPIAYLLAPILAKFGIIKSIPAIVQLMNLWLFGSGGAAVAVNAMEGVDKSSAIYNQQNKRKNKYDRSWFINFIQSLSNTND